MLINCGGLYDPQRLETVLRVSFPRIGDTERKLGTVRPSGISASRFRAKVTEKRTAKTRGWQKAGGRHRVHEVDVESQAPAGDGVQEDCVLQAGQGGGSEEEEFHVVVPRR